MKVKIKCNLYNLQLYVKKELEYKILAHITKLMKVF